MKVRKKPVVVDAVQFVPSELAALEDFMEQNLAFSTDGDVLIKTLEGVLTAKPFDWIIKGVKGEFYPCKPDIFAQTYEPESSEAK